MEWDLMQDYLGWNQWWEKESGASKSLNQANYYAPRELVNKTGLQHTPTAESQESESESEAPLNTRIRSRYKKR